MRQHVLVVEDDAAIREVVAAALEDEGYRVATATNGVEALRAVEQREPSAIVLDLMMPGMDGWQFLDACRRAGRCQDVPILVMSAAHDPRQATTLPQVKGALAKPFDLDVLLGAVQRLVEKPD